MSKPQALEIELKLRVPPAAYARLARHAALAGVGSPLPQRLHAIYFDTASQSLWRSGLALRVRREGKTWTQTLKGEGRVEAGLHQRIELEAPVAGPVPDLQAFPPGPWSERVAAAVGGAPLEPVCITQFSRSVRLLQRGPGVFIEASLDRGRVRGGGTEEGLCELELELKSGPPAALYELALELLDAVPLAVEGRSKAERGYALQSGTVPAPVAAQPVALERGMSVSAASTVVIAAVLAHIQGNEDGVQRSNEPEYAHQMRVGVRRLRSALSVFRPALEPGRRLALVEELRWIGRVLGGARDWDVFMATTFGELKKAFPGHDGIAAYGREFVRRQRLARPRTRQALASSRYQRLVLGLGAWLHNARSCGAEDAEAQARLDEPVVSFAARVLETRYARLRKRGREFEHRSDRELHALRIAAKKLRYAAQFFAALYDEEAASALLARLARLQEALGGLNDAVAVQALVESASPRAGGPAVAEAGGMLLAWNRGRAELLRREARRAWRGVRRSPTFW